MVRGSRLEQIGPELFLVGLFSLLDVMLNVSMVDVMDKLPLEEEVKTALINKQRICAPFLRIALAYERNQTRQLEVELTAVGMTPTLISSHYLEAVRYTKGLLL